MTIKNATIIGAGNVGAALARHLIKSGITVQLATQDLAKTREAAAKLGANVKAVEPGALEAGVDAVFLAVPAEAAAAALAGAPKLAAGTLVIDCTNPLRWDNGPVHTPPAEGSITAQLAKQFPTLRVVKAFNTFGAEFHDNAKLGATAADLYIAGDDADGKQQLTELGKALGYDVVDVGPLRNAALLESFAMIWIHLATVGGHGREVAFKLLKR